MAQIANFISGCQEAVGSTKMQVKNVTCAIPSPTPAGGDGHRLNSKDLIWEDGKSTGMRARIATMWMRTRRMKHRMLMVDQHRMWRPEDIVDWTCQPAMSMGMSASVATMWMWMRRNKHHKPMMDQLRIWRNEGIVRESVEIGLYVFDM